MDIEAFRAYCLSKKGVTEEFPFDENTLVFKVMGKMFTATDLNEFASINLKVDPEKSILLQEAWPSVSPGYHMNKRHWITVSMDGSIPDSLIISWIDESYDLVAAGLTKTLRSALESL